MDKNLLENFAKAIRVLSADAVENANSGHPGMPLGMADVASVLFSNHLKFYAKEPKWQNRDRFVLSAGHGSMLLYSVLYLTGYEDITIDDIKNFRQLGSKCAGHPEYEYLKGVETTTGPLGQGIATAVGMALAEKKLKAEFGSDIIDNKIYVFAGDGDLMEGLSYEACSLAGHLKLNNLIVFWDNNKITIDGKTDISRSEDVLLRFKSQGFETYDIDGHNYDDINQAVIQAKKSEKPVLISCKTKIGKYAGEKENSEKAHGSPLGAEALSELRKALNWDYPSFEIPNDLLKSFHNLGIKHKDEYENWVKISKSNEKFLERINNTKIDIKKEIQSQKEKFINEKMPIATRKAFNKVLDVIWQKIPGQLVSGSADLTPSNNTRISEMKDINASDFSGNYIHYGIREHAMAAVMNGISLYFDNILIPFGGTFLVFSDYLKPALRLSAMMHRHVVYVLTHDSIGLGEDGPTHQPIEHLESLRAIPNINIFRPADSVETAECLELALTNKNTPSVLVLSRQNLPVLCENTTENNSSKGAYIIFDNTKGNDKFITLIAIGSEVSLAIETAELLSKENILSKVVSMPSCELFDEQDIAYKEKIISTKSLLRVAIEAGSKNMWYKYADIVFGMDSFGKSGPYKKVYEYFNLTKENISKKIIEQLNAKIPS